MAINRRGGVYRSDTSIGEGIAAIDSAIDQAEAAQLAAQQARDAALVAKTAAETAETNAETAEANAAASANSASTSASQAAGSANSAATEASNAANSASQASTHASNASTSASNAATSASNASTSETNAANSAAAAAASYDSFDDRYLGAKASDPTLDNDGNALITGALYFNTTSSEFRGYNGTSWISLPATTATNVTFSATGNIAATNVQTAIAEVDSEKVAKAGDTMTGTLVVPAVQMDTPFSFRNKIINGNFDIWQRGTSGSTGFVADRWKTNLAGSTATITAQDFAAGQADVPGGPRRFHRVVVTSVAGADNYAQTLQAIEDVRATAGTTLTLSFYAKADAPKNIAIEFVQVFGTGGTPSATVTGIGAQLLALTASWQKFTVTVAIPSIAGKTLGTNEDHYLALNFWYDAGSNLAARAASLGQQSGTFDIARIQIEEGSVATPFEDRPVGLELSLCQRYFYQPRADLPGFVSSSTGILCHCAFPVVMRTAPAVALSTTSPAGEAPWFGVSQTASGASVVGSHLFADAVTLVIGGFSGLTVNDRACIFGQYLSFSAEL